MLDNAWAVLTAKEEDDTLDDALTILTAKEAAEYLRVSLYTLRRMETNGNLTPYRTPGGHRRYSLKMLNEYLGRSRTRSPHRRPGDKS